MTVEEFLAELDTEKIKSYDWYLTPGGYIRAKVTFPDQPGRWCTMCPIEAIGLSKTGKFEGYRSVAKE